MTSNVPPGMKNINIPEEFHATLQVERAYIQLTELDEDETLTLTEYVTNLLEGKWSRRPLITDSYKEKSGKQKSLWIPIDLYRQLVLEATIITRETGMRMTMREYVIRILNGEMNREKWTELSKDIRVKITTAL